MRKEPLYPNHSWQTAQNVNTANVRTPILEFTVQVGSSLGVRSIHVPIIDLRDASNDQIDNGSLITVAVQKPAWRVPDLAPAPFALHDHHELTRSEQRKAENRGRNGTLQKDIGKHWTVTEEDRIIIMLDSPDVIDWSNSYYQFEVAYRERR